MNGTCVVIMLCYSSSHMTNLHSNIVPPSPSLHGMLQTQVRTLGPPFMDNNLKENQLMAQAFKIHLESNLYGCSP